MTRRWAYHLGRRWERWRPLPAPREVVEGAFTTTTYGCGCETWSGPDVMSASYCWPHGLLERWRTAREVRTARRRQAAKAAQDLRQYQCDRCGYWTHNPSVRTWI